MKQSPKALGMTERANPSRAELRRALRRLPGSRRRALLRAVRQGRAVDEPRDATLAVAWARRVQVFSWPRWVLPQTRPHGRGAALWLLHGAWLAGALLLTAVQIQLAVGRILGWIFAGTIVYSIIGAPWFLAVILRTRWNAPEAERRNRQLLGCEADG